MASPHMSAVVWQTNFAGLKLSSPRQGPRHLRTRRPPADRRDRPPFRVRRRPAHADSRQGTSAHATLAFLVRKAAGRPAEPRDLSATDFPGELAPYAASSWRAARCWCSRTDPVPDRMRRARIHFRLGLEGLPAHGQGLRDSRCRPGCANRDRLPEPIFTPSTKATTRPR